MLKLLNRSAAVEDHEKILKSILRKSPKEFREWVVSISDEELTYIEWLLDKAESMVDEILIEQSDLIEAKRIIDRAKGVQ